MLGQSQYQNVFRITKKDVSSNGTHPRPTKRNRQPISCLACRTRKSASFELMLKCGRQNPCAACSKRGDEGLCVYSSNRRNGRDEFSKEGSKAAEAQLRLQKLEQMVANLLRDNRDTSINPTRQTPPYNVTVEQSLTNLSVNGSPQYTSSDDSSKGHLNTSGLGANYTGATHWATVLENIRDIQSFLKPEAENGDEISPSSAADDPDLVFGTTRSMTLADVWNYLPPRPVVDKLISVYFDAGYHQSPILHKGKFLREYKSFCQDPSSVSFLWISMLFSALWLGSLYGQSSDEEGLHSPNELNFFKYAAQALVTGQYHKAKPYSVEAMVLHAQCRWMQKTDRGTDGWMIISISTRLAMRMGYHRDPHHLANISPFEGEMRRRTFSIVEIFDLLLSFRAGLPAIIHEEECDTQPPRNLFDEDFDEDCKILPPSRPSTDPTPMLYFVYKSGFAKLMKRVIRHALSLKPPLYKETMKLDDDLHKMHDNVPPSLQMRPLSTLFTDQTHVVINKLYIDMVYLKSLCVLHRFSLSHERSNPALAYSRKTCTDAALQLLKHQAEVYALCQPEGRFFNDKFMLSTLVMHDFLFAAMMICLDLYESYQISPATSQEELVAQTTEYDALRLTHEIWTWRKAFSKDAHRASNVVAVMLSKVPRPVPLGIPRFKNHGGPGVFTMATSSGSTSWETTLFDNVKGPQSFWLGNCPTLDVNRADDTPPPPLPVDLADIDWGLFDQYLLDRGGADDVSLD